MRRGRKKRKREGRGEGEREGEGRREKRTKRKENCVSTSERLTSSFEYSYLMALFTEYDRNR